MATKEQIRELLKAELRPINGKLEVIEAKFNDLQTAVDFLSTKYDTLLSQVQSSNEKLLALTSTSKNLKKDIQDVQKTAGKAANDYEELAQYLCRDCLEIAGIQPTRDLSCNHIVKSIGEALDLEITDSDISTSHPVPSYNKDASPKIIVKFTRRDVRNTFYGNRKKLKGKKVKNLPSLNLGNNNNYIYISESLTPSKKKLFGRANKLKKRLKWKFIWTNNGRIYLKESDNTNTHVIDSEENMNELELQYHSSNNASAHN